jgi:hypothetical protein
MKYFRISVFALVIFTFIINDQNRNKSFLPKYDTLLQKALEKPAERKGSIRCVLNSARKSQLEATSFLIAHLPEGDMKSLSVKFFKDQAGGAYKAKKEFFLVC